MALASYTQTRRPRTPTGGNTQFCYAITASTSKTAQSLVPAVASQYGVITKLCVSVPTYCKLTILYGGTTIGGPYFVNKGENWILPHDILGPSGTTIKFQTAATVSITLSGEYGYSRDT